MKHNYILLPENIQRRPLPGHRHRPRKVNKVSDETFSPYSRAGRRATGEAKDKAATASNTKKAEERSGLRLRKFIKELNRFLAVRRKSTMVDVTAEQTVAQDPNDSVAASLELPSRSSAVEVIEVHRVKRPRANAISGSSRVKPEDVHRPPDALNPPDTLNLAGRVETSGENSTVPGAVVCAERARIETDDNIHLRLPSNAGVVQSHDPPIQSTVLHTVPLAFPGHIPAPPRIDWPNPILPEPNHRPLQFWFPDIQRNTEAQLERIAIACACAGMDEPMDIDPPLPPFMPNDDDVDIEMEHIAVACAYAAIDDPMDTTLDDTHGPIINVTHQEQRVLNPDGFVQYPPPQLPYFDLGAALQPPIHETFRPPEHQSFLDHDQRLRPPFIHPHQIAQPLVHQLPAPELNQAFPAHPPVDANHNQPVEEYFPTPLPPPFDIVYHPPLVVNQQQNDFLEHYIPLPPIAQHELNDQPRPHIFFGEGYNILAAINHLGNEEQDHEPEDAYHPGDLGFFVDEEGEAGAEGEERLFNHAGLFEELFGDEHSEDEDEEELLLVI